VFAIDWIVFGRNESKIFIEVIKLSNKRVITYKGEDLLFFTCNSHFPIFFCEDSKIQQNCTQTAVLLSYKSTYIGIWMGWTALGVPVSTNLFWLMGVSLPGYKLDYPRFDSWQEPDSYVFSEPNTEPPIQWGLGALTGSKVVAAWDYHSPSSAEFSYTFTPPTCLHSEHRPTFT
jgi:hypothetical protein